MGEGFSIGSIIPRTFGSNLVRIKAKKSINEFLAALGHDNIMYCVRCNKNLCDMINPDVLSNYKQKASQNAWLANVLDKRTVLSLIDDALVSQIMQEPNGGIWLNTQLRFLESLFIGG